MRRAAILLCGLLAAAVSAFAQGGPPYYTTDPGTPGPNNWEINLAYMPFLNGDQSVSHVPDVDINYGIGKHLQLTYENAWLRVRLPGSATKYGLGQSNGGLKWRFLDGGESGLSISVFPQFFVNNPNDSVRRGLTPAAQSFLMPMEFSRPFGPVDVNLELGYQFFHKAPNGWLTGLVVGHKFGKRFEADAEFFSTGTFHPRDSEPSFDVGARYKLHNPVILLLMAGRSLEHEGSTQQYFVGYFGVQILLPSRAYNAE